MANYPKYPLEIKAWEFAKEKHKSQVRKFLGKPYFDAHVQKVNGILKMYNIDEELLAASLLHDVIEDCYENITDGYNEIKEIFGKRVADIVLELTSIKDDILSKHDGSKTKYLIEKMLKMSDDALEIKLCDRLQNISDAFTASPKFRINYCSETNEICKSLRDGRRLNRNQNLILREIESKLHNVESIFQSENRIIPFDDFKKI